MYSQLNNQQLLMTSPCLASRAFEYCDNEELYQLNLVRQPADWYYRTHSVEYVWNTNGYRAPEWVDVDWPNSHVVMGCSFVAGIGVTGEDTVSSQLAQQLGEPVINLGYSSAGPYVTQYNSLMLARAGIKPKSVSIVATEISRYTLFDRLDECPKHLVAGSYDNQQRSHQELYKQYLLHENNYQVHGRVAIDTAQALWQGLGVPTYVYTYQTTEHFWQRLPIVDYGRDLNPSTGHAGRLTYQRWASIMFDKIRR